MGQTAEDLERLIEIADAQIAAAVANKKNLQLALALQKNVERLQRKRVREHAETVESPPEATLPPDLKVPEGYEYVPEKRCGTCRHAVNRGVKRVTLYCRCKKALACRGKMVKVHRVPCEQWSPGVDIYG